MSTTIGDDYYDQIAKAYIALSDTERAYAEIDKGIAINPVDPYIYLRAGDLYRDRAEYGKAVQYYQKSVEVDPETYEVRADGELLTCEPATVLPMAQRYFLF